MKTYKQKRKRRLARERDRKNKATWRYLAFDCICPGRDIDKRDYIIYDAKTKKYLSMLFYDVQKGPETQCKFNGKKYAEKYDAFRADWIIKFLKEKLGKRGAFQAIRIK